MKIYAPEKEDFGKQQIDKMFNNACNGDTRGTLTGLEIYRQVKNGGIVIEPFNEDQINPNSYNLKLGPELKIYTDFPLAFDKPNPTKTIEIPKEGFILRPGCLYLGTTIERVYTSKFKPCINGRSSGGRLGIDIHKCAGFGDVGFDGQWTLEIEVIHPVVVTPGLEIAQISFDTLCGNPDYQYRGRYHNQVGTTASRVEQPKKGRFTDFYKDYKLKYNLYRIFKSKDTYDKFASNGPKNLSNAYLKHQFEDITGTSEAYDFLEYGKHYEVSYDLQIGEEENDYIIYDTVGIVGYIYLVNGEKIYVRKYKD